MKANLDCIPCLMRQALEAARMATEDEAIQEQILREVAGVIREMSFESTPPEIAHRIHGIVREATGNADPYEKVKKRDNELVLRMYPRLKEMVAKSENRLKTAVKLAAAGNIIDYGASSMFNIEDTVKKVLEKDFAIDRLDAFRERLESADSMIYLADNAGEIVFDRVLIEEMEGKDITLIVKGGPIINDATVEDAKAVGLDELVKLDILGNGTPGTGPERTDPAFLAKLRGADIVLSKGQGNYESLSNERYVFFLLMAKCPLIARNIGVKQGEIVLAGGERE